MAPKNSKIGVEKNEKPKKIHNFWMIPTMLMKKMIVNHIIWVVLYDSKIQVIANQDKGNVKNWVAIRKATFYDTSKNAEINWLLYTFEH